MNVEVQAINQAMVTMTLEMEAGMAVVTTTAVAVPVVEIIGNNVASVLVQADAENLVLM